MVRTFGTGRNLGLPAVLGYVMLTDSYISFITEVVLSEFSEFYTFKDFDV